jgi:phage-related protein
MPIVGIPRLELEQETEAAHSQNCYRFSFAKLLALFVSAHFVVESSSMPQTNLILYVEDDGSIPLRDWLIGLQLRARARCITRLELLEEFGHELRRPHAEYLEGTDLYELRIKFHRVNLRMLYFFHGQEAAVVSHGFAKEGKLPPKEIELATERMNKFKADPERHTLQYEGNADG